jgi:hypothetical protein
MRALAQTILGEMPHTPRQRRPATLASPASFDRGVAARSYTAINDAAPLPAATRLLDS